MVRQGTAPQGRSDLEPFPENRAIGLQSFRRPLEDHPAVSHDANPSGHFQRDGERLLDAQNRHAGRHNALDETLNLFSANSNVSKSHKHVSNL